MLPATATIWRLSANSRLPHAMAAGERFAPAATPDCRGPRVRRDMFVLAAVTLGTLGSSSASAMVFKVIGPDGGLPALSMSGEILPGDTARALPLLIQLAKDNIAPSPYLSQESGALGL